MIPRNISRKIFFSELSYYLNIFISTTESIGSVKLITSLKLKIILAFLVALKSLTWIYTELNKANKIFKIWLASIIEDLQNKCVGTTLKVYSVFHTTKKTTPPE